VSVLSGRRKGIQMQVVACPAVTTVVAYIARRPRQVWVKTLI